jgi:chorismate dehydratase
MLAEGSIDLCPSSSIEYAKGADAYCILPELSISSIGPVKSVLLFSRVPIEQLGNQTIGITTESDTSVCLLKIILSLQFGYANSFVRTSLPLTEALESFAAHLLIGDSALKSALENNYCHIYDLGDLWYRFTGLPFVFALWIVRRDAVLSKRAELTELQKILRESKRIAYESYFEIAEESAAVSWMSPAALVEYWQTISYDLTPQHVAGVRRFFKLAREVEMLGSEPEIIMLDQV